MTMNCLFDVFNVNSHSKLDCFKPYEGNEEDLTKLEASREWVNSWKFVNYKGKSRILPCQEGWLLNINALKQLFNDLKSQTFKYVFTTRLNQDSIEGLFGMVRGMNGYNQYPDAMTFKNSIKKVICTGIINYSENANSSPDLSEFVLKLNHVSPSGYLSDKLIRPDEPTLQSEFVPDLNLQALKYVGGYLAYKVLKQTPCSKCSTLMCDVPNSENVNTENVFIVLKKYEENSRLLEPKNGLWCAVKKMEALFQEYAFVLREQKGIQLFFGNLFSEHFQIDFFCEEHTDNKNILFKHFLTTRIRAEVSEMNRRRSMAKSEKKTLSKK